MLQRYLREQLGSHQLLEEYRAARQKTRPTQLRALECWMEVVALLRNAGAKTFKTVKLGPLDRGSIGRTKCGTVRPIHGSFFAVGYRINAYVRKSHVLARTPQSELPPARTEVRPLHGVPPLSVAGSRREGGKKKPLTRHGSFRPLDAEVFSTPLPPSGSQRVSFFFESLNEKNSKFILPY